MKILFACMALLCMANRADAQAFFPEGTRWTELRLDTREHQTWCDEEKRDGGSVLVPNYEQIEYYVQGDSTDEVLTYIGMCGGTWRENLIPSHLSFAKMPIR